MSELVWGYPEGVQGRRTPAGTRIEIQELYAKYAWAIDSGDGPAVAALFLEEGDYITRSGVWAGRAGVTALVERIRSTAAGRGKQHWITNCLFEGDGDVVVARAMGAGPRVDPDGGGNTVDFVGYYDDIYRRKEGSWYFERRIWRNWEQGENLPAFNDASDLVAQHAPA